MLQPTFVLLGFLLGESHRVRNLGDVSTRDVLFPERLPNGTFPNGDEWAVWISKPSDVPVAPSDVPEGDLYYLEAGIVLADGLDTGKFDYFHSGIGVKFGEESMAVEWYAKDGLQNAVFPDAKGTWHNDAILGVSPMNRSYWAKETRIGGITGAVWNDFRMFLANYANKHRYYQFWRIESSGGDMLIEEDICDTFSEAAIRELIKMGVEADSDAIMRRNYVSIVTDGLPTKIDMNDPVQMAQVGTYYNKLGDAMSKASLHVHTVVQKVKVVKKVAKIRAERGGNVSFGAKECMLQNDPRAVLQVVDPLIKNLVHETMADDDVRDNPDVAQVLQVALEMNATIWQVALEMNALMKNATVPEVSAQLAANNHLLKMFQKMQLLAHELNASVPKSDTQLVAHADVDTDHINQTDTMERITLKAKGVGHEITEVMRDDVTQILRCVGDLAVVAEAQETAAGFAQIMVEAKLPEDVIFVGSPHTGFIKVFPWKTEPFRSGYEEIEL